MTGPDGIAFGAPPPALLLNLPLLPLGVENARYVWIVAGALAWLFVMRRLDCAVVAPVHSLPRGLPRGDRRRGPRSRPARGQRTRGDHQAVQRAGAPGGRVYRGILAGAGLFVVTLPLLPWGMFLADLGSIRAVLESQAAHVSAWGDPLLMLAAERPWCPWDASGACGCSPPSCGPAHSSTIRCSRPRSVPVPVRSRSRSRSRALPLTRSSPTRSSIVFGVWRRIDARHERLSTCDPVALCGFVRIAASSGEISMVLSAQSVRMASGRQQHLGADVVVLGGAGHVGLPLSLALVEGRPVQAASSTSAEQRSTSVADWPHAVDGERRRRAPRDECWRAAAWSQQRSRDGQRGRTP